MGFPIRFAARSAPVLVIAVVSIAADWTRVSSPDFEVLTTAGAAEGRRTLEYFEQVREFFLQGRPDTRDDRLPVAILLFRDQKEFRPYSPNEVAVAFYVGDKSRDFIVMSSSIENDKAVAVHEYVHLLLRRLDLRVPLWLNEGIAEVYSTLKPNGGKVTVGEISRKRASVLRSEHSLPLASLFTIDQKSPLYNRREHAGAFYAQSWMLVHMLLLSDSYRPNFSRFLAQLSDGKTPSSGAFLNVYSKTVEDVERDLESYFRSGELRIAVFDTKPPKISSIQDLPAEQFAVDVQLARILAATGRSEDALARLGRLASEFSDRWEVYEATGQVLWRKGRLAEARAAMRRAIDLNPSLWSVYWDYAQLHQYEPTEQVRVLEALRKAVGLNPSHLDARLMLGHRLVQLERPAEALVIFDAVSGVPPEKAPRLFLGQAWAHAKLNHFEQARVAAVNAGNSARDPADADAARRILRYIETRKTAGTTRTQETKP